MSFDDLMKLPESCIQRWNDWTHWRIDDFCQKIASDIKTIKCIDGFDDDAKKIATDDETIRCTDEFSNLSENCTWHWNNQMYWRIFKFARKLHLTLKRSNALTSWQWCQKHCIWRWNDRMHWRIFFFHLLSNWELQAIDSVDDVNWKCRLYVRHFDQSQRINIRLIDRCVVREIAFTLSWNRSAIRWSDRIEYSRQVREVAVRSETKLSKL